MKDFYYILGTERGCSPDELNSAYRKLAQQLQPTGPEPDLFLDSHMQEVTEAYLVLSDPVKRRKYDAAYRKSYMRRGYYFRLSYLNVAATVALIMFTALFGMYVNKVLSGSKTKTVVKTASVAPAFTASRHKKKRHAATNHIAKKHIQPIDRDSIKQQIALAPKPVPAKPIIAAVIKPAPVINPKQVAVPVINPKPVTVQAPAEKPVTANSAPEKPLFTNDTSPSSYTAYLKANVTGVVSLHQQGNYRSAVLASIPNNSKVQVLEKGPGFYKIAYNGQTGYVPKWTVAEE